MSSSYLWSEGSLAARHSLFCVNTMADDLACTTQILLNDERNISHMYGDNMFTDGCEATPKDEIGAKSGKDMRLWYRQPASDWEEGLPIGNGYVGAMVLGTVEQDRIALNHCRLWRERRLRGKENPKVAHNLPRIREMFLEMFFWVVENRPDWLQEAIDRKKRMLGKKAGGASGRGGGAEEGE